MEPTIMQRDNERRRLTGPGTRTDDGERCTVVVIHECSGDWAFFPHGAAQLGVRISGPDAATVAREILGDAEVDESGSETRLTSAEKRACPAPPGQAPTGAP
jgi:hypothetical protein